LTKARKKSIHTISPQKEEFMKNYTVFLLLILAIMGAIALGFEGIPN